MSGRFPVVFLVDVDNTLLDNDHIQNNLWEHLEREFGAACRDRYCVNSIKLAHSEPSPAHSSRILSRPVALQACLSYSENRERRRQATRRCCPSLDSIHDGAWPIVVPWCLK